MKEGEEGVKGERENVGAMSLPKDESVEIYK